MKKSIPVNLIDLILEETESGGLRMRAKEASDDHGKDVPSGYCIAGVRPLNLEAESRDEVMNWLLDDQKQQAFTSFTEDFLKQPEDVDASVNVLVVDVQMPKPVAQIARFWLKSIAAE